MVILKLLALKWAFHLKPSRSAVCVILLLAVGIAIFPQLSEQYDGSKETLHLCATWYGIGLVAFASWKRPQIPCRLTFDKWGELEIEAAIGAAAAAGRRVSGHARRAVAGFCRAGEFAAGPGYRRSL